MTKWKYCIASITDACNNRCPGCYRVLQGNLCWQDNAMNVEDFRQILHLFASGGGESIDFVGGEPTLHPQFLQMIGLCIEAGIEVWVYTNLREFGKDVELGEQILSFGGNVTVVGKLNVPRPYEPEQKRIQARLIGASEEAVDEMWQGLRNLLSVGFPAGKIGVENLVRANNIDIAPAVYEKGMEMGFFVDLEVPACPVTAEKKSFQRWLALFPSKEQILACIKGVACVNERYGIEPYTPIMPHITGRNQQGLGAGCVSFKQGALLTESDGRIGMCTSGTPLLDDSGRQLNILVDQLGDVFQHADLIARRRSCEQCNIESGHCVSCGHWENCLGGCAALRETFGMLFDSYPLCYMHEWPTDDELLRFFEKAQK